MTNILNPTFLRIWSDFIAHSKRGELDTLDELSRNIIFLVGTFHMRNRKINFRRVINEYHMYTAPTIYGRIHNLIENSWLVTKTDPDDRRGQLLSLSEKSVGYLNKMSAIIERRTTEGQQNRQYIAVDI